MNEIEFTRDEIRAVWQALFKTTPPKELTVKQIYDACLMELGPEILRQELRERNYV